MRYWILALMAGWFSIAQAGPFGDDELLPVREAFSFEASPISPDRIRARWNIADGYYLYKSKLRFSTDASGIKLGEPVLPPGKVKKDEFFGTIETYRHQVVAEIPVTREAGAPASFELKAGSQGCADIGVCYPPQTQIARIELPPAKAPTTNTGSPVAQALNGLDNSPSFGDEEALLPADEAFRLDVHPAEDGSAIVADWTIAEGYYLYRHRFEFRLAPADGVRLGKAELPEGEHKNDEFFGDIQVFHRQVSARLPLIRSRAAAMPVTLTLGYQGCAERGVCYPPISKTIELQLPPLVATGTTTTPPAKAAPPPPAAPAVAPAATLSEQDALAERLGKGNVLATLLAFFGFGLLLSLTPCVFPMIPILSSIIVGQGENITARKGFVLSLVYVLAMAVTYTVAGVFAGVFGENLQAAFQNPWILYSFAAVFVLLSLSMFGFYDLQMPAFIQSRLTTVSNRQKGGSLTGVAVMGFLSALIVGPCVAAPLAGALIYIGQTGDAVLGGMALFALSLGMGAPLIAIGTGAGKLLPKAGSWMDRIKAVFGVLLLAVAVWMLERVLPGPLTLVLWAALLVLSAVYLRALDDLPVEATGWSRFWKGVGVVLLAWGVLLLIGAATGSGDPFQPLARVTGSLSAGPSPAQPAHLQFKRIKSVDDLERELAVAAAQGKPVMLDFYADWCVSCKEMEKYTFGDPAVQRALSGLVLLQADVTANDAADKALLKHFHLLGPPSILFFDARGEPRPDLTLVGYKPPAEFAAHVAKLR